MSASSTSEALLSVNELSVRFLSQDRVVHAVRDLSFSVPEGKITALVGESGSGKSTAALAISRLLPTNAAVTGRIRFQGTELLSASDREMRRIRGNRIGIIFQDPFTCLNPVKTVGWQIAEVLKTHSNLGKAEIRERVLELLVLVGIPRPHEQQNQYPHQFSGGMRQRVMIAIAVACDPALLIADEPTTALDVTIQEKIAELLGELASRLSMSILLITHNLGLVARLADSVVVAYAGRVAETASVDELFAYPRHPYTVGLIRAVPQLHAKSGQGLSAIPGAPPSPYEEFPGCAFAERCPRAVQVCKQALPPLQRFSNHHASACINPAFYATDASGEER